MLTGRVSDLKGERMYRHGDVLLMKAELPEGSTEQVRSKRVVLAEGEATGHSHDVITKEMPAITFLAPDGEMYLELQEDAQLVHQEHAIIDLPVGMWWVIHQREYTPERLQRVRD